MKNIFGSGEKVVEDAIEKLLQEIRSTIIPNLELIEALFMLKLNSYWKTMNHFHLKLRLILLFLKPKNNFDWLMDELDFDNWNDFKLNGEKLELLVTL